MPDKMNDPRDLFLHELGDVLYAERTLVKALPKLQKEASDEELASGFAAHLEETRQHVKNVEQAFDALGEPAKAQQLLAALENLCLLPCEELKDLERAIRTVL